MIRTVLVLAALALTAWAGAASADEFHVHGDLLCHRKAAIALVRFTTSYSDDRPVYRRLPAGVDGGLSALPGSDRTDCRRPDGQAIRLRTGEEQSFAYGAGGAAPPRFFSLWIDRRKVISKQVWREGYDNAVRNLPMLVGVVIRPQRLTFCYASEAAAAVSCRDEKLKLAAAAIDTVEYGARHPKVGTILLGAGTRDPLLCRRYLRTLGTHFEDLLLRQTDHWAFASPIAWETRPYAEGPYVVVAQFAPTPGAQPVRVTSFSGTSHYFDGDVFIVTPLSVAVADLEAFWKANDPEMLATTPRPAGWSLIAGGIPGLYPKVSTRYVHLRPQQIDGRFHVLAYPANHRQRPTAVLLRLTPQAEVEPVCEFLRVEPHF